MTTPATHDFSDLLHLARQNNTFVLLLRNCGNPDRGQDPDRPVWGTPSDYWVPVESLQAASTACRTYIEEHDLGGGNWSGGKVVDGNGVQVASISYNGRIWPKQADGTDAPEPAPTPDRPRGG